MSIVHAGFVAASVASVPSFKEVSSVCARSRSALSRRDSSCSASLRRNTQESLRKNLVWSTRRCSNMDGRLQIRAKEADQSTVRSVPVQVAHELINAGHRCLDVRTSEEFVAGHAKGAVNIPYLVKTGHGLSKNSKFLTEVEKGFSKDDEIIVGCQSGRRSLMAAAELRDANFTGVTDMGGGYLAWKESGLPVNMPHQA